VISVFHLSCFDLRFNVFWAPEILCHLLVGDFRYRWETLYDRLPEMGTDDLLMGLTNWLADLSCQNGKLRIYTLPKAH